MGSFAKVSVGNLATKEVFQGILGIRWNQPLYSFVEIGDGCGSGRYPIPHVQ